ncbi:hypothetical protein Btru_053735 [Bulinus truncatus]|nr:hypothetical protein Btru_053735 [Bulinus truncatus]
MVALSSLCLYIIPLVIQYAQGQPKPTIWSMTNIFQEGQKVTLKCYQVSSAPIKFLWSVPHLIKKPDRNSYEKKIDEKLTEYSNTFSFIARRLDNARTFSCSSNYDGGSVPSDPFTIYVFLIPFVPILKGPTYVVEKSGYHTWSCEVYGGSITPARVNFKHNGEAQQGEIATHVMTTHAEHRHWLYKKIVNITMRIPDEASSYNLECEFISDFANFYIVQSGAIEVIVLWTKPRTFPLATAMLAYMANTKIYLNCTYRSFGVDSMKWETDYIRLSSGTFINGTYTEEGATVFWLANIFIVTAFDNDRNFTCVVTKNNEQLRADPIKLFIYNPPYLKRLESVNSSHEGEIIQATCVVSNASFVKPEIVWSCNDVSACVNVGKVLAQRCLESGINAVFFDDADKKSGSARVQLFVEEFKNANIALTEPEMIEPNASPGINYDGFNRYAEPKVWKENYQDI